MKQINLSPIQVIGIFLILALLSLASCQKETSTECQGCDLVIGKFTDNVLVFQTRTPISCDSASRVITRVDTVRDGNRHLQIMVTTVDCQR